MNQLTTMLDTDLGIDPRVRGAGGAGDVEAAVDFEEVLFGIAKPGDVGRTVIDEAHGSRLSKKPKTELSLDVEPEAIVPAALTKTLTPEQRARAPEGASANATQVEGATIIPADPLTASAPTSGETNAAASTPAAVASNVTAATSTVAEAVVASGRAMRITSARGDEAARSLSMASEAALPIPSAVTKAIDSGARARTKTVGGLGSSAGFALPPATAAAAASTEDSVRLAPAQQKLLASLEAKVLDTSPAAVTTVDPTAWSINSLSREDSVSPLRPLVSAEASLASPMGSEEWQVDLGNQLVAMIEKGDQSAVINLSPVELGPVQIDVAVREGEVSVAFAAQVADTRTAIEASLPKLKEMLAGEGFSLTNTSINNDLSGFSQQRSSSRGVEERPSPRGRFAEPEATVLVQTAPNRLRRSLVDLYA